jgi:hypothetical protein
LRVSRAASPANRAPHLAQKLASASCPRPHRGHTPRPLTATSKRPAQPPDRAVSGPPPRPVNDTCSYRKGS